MAGTSKWMGPRAIYSLDDSFRALLPGNESFRDTCKQGMESENLRGSKNLKAIYIRTRAAETDSDLFPIAVLLYHYQKETNTCLIVWAATLITERRKGAFKQLLQGMKTRIRDEYGRSKKARTKTVVLLETTRFSAAHALLEKFGFEPSIDPDVHKRIEGMPSAIRMKRNKPMVVLQLNQKKQNEAARTHCRKSDLDLYPDVKEQVQLVHDLVIVVAWRLVFITGKHAGIRAFKENHSSAILVEHRMLLGIVKTVILWAGLYILRPRK